MSPTHIKERFYRLVTETNGYLEHLRETLGTMTKGYLTMDDCDVWSKQDLIFCSG